MNSPGINSTEMNRSELISSLTRSTFSDTKKDSFAGAPLDAVYKVANDSLPRDPDRHVWDEIGWTILASQQLSRIGQNPCEMVREYPHQYCEGDDEQSWLVARYYH